MKNPLMSRLLGESDDVVPVIANTPRETFRNRAVQSRQIEDETDDSVQRMVGEAKTEKYGKGQEGDDEDEGILPDNAELVDPSEMVVGKPLRQPKEIVQEPSHPAGDKEKYQTPYAALTAPDVTPQSTQPIDPSQIPGAAGAEKFTAADLERAGSVKPAEGDVAARAMDVLLGHNRAAKAATQPGEFAQAGEIATTEEQAAAMLGIQSPLYEEASAKAASVLVPATDGGGAMPPPTPISDGAAVYSTFRRFTG